MADKIPMILSVRREGVWPLNPPMVREITPTSTPGLLTIGHLGVLGAGAFLQLWSFYSRGDKTPLGQDPIF